MCITLENSAYHLMATASIQTLIQVTAHDLFGSTPLPELHFLSTLFLSCGVCAQT